MPFVLTLGTRGTAHMLMTLFEDGRLDLAAAESWPLAADRLAKNLSGTVRCEPGLAMVGRRFGWVPHAPGPEVLRTRAAVMLSLSLGWPADWVDDVAALIDAWRGFWALRPWVDAPAELALPVLFERAGRSEPWLLAVLGQAGTEFGLALYETLDDFDRVWNGELPRGATVSVLTWSLPTAFDPLDVPAVVVVRSEAGKGLPATRRDLELAVAALRLAQGEEPVTTPAGVLTIDRARAKSAKSQSKSAKSPASKKRPASPKRPPAKRRRRTT